MMTERLQASAICALVFSTLLAACQVTPTTNETTGPTITFTQTGAGTITSISYSASSNTQIFFNALANDAGGVKLINLQFSPTVPSCTTGGGAVYSGDFVYKPVPPSQNIPASPNSSGQLPSELFATTTLQGPFTCTIPGQKAAGWPIGDTISAIVQATNASGKTTTATLPINLH